MNNGSFVNSLLVSECGTGATRKDLKSDLGKKEGFSDCADGFTIQCVPHPESSGQNTLDVEIENHIEQNRQGQQGERKKGKQTDLVADCLEVFKQLLLFKRIAIRGFTDHLQLVFDPFEGRILVHDLVA